MGQNSDCRQNRKMKDLMKIRREDLSRPLDEYALFLMPLPQQWWPSQGWKVFPWQIETDINLSQKSAPTVQYFQIILWKPVKKKQWTQYPGKRTRIKTKDFSCVWGYTNALITVYSHVICAHSTGTGSRFDIYLRLYETQKDLVSWTAKRIKTHV